MSEITDEEKAQARRDAGIFEPEDYPELNNGYPELQEDYHEPAPEPIDPVEALKQRYEAGQIGYDLLEQEARKLAEQRTVSEKPPRLDWKRLMLAVGVAIESGIQAYQNYRDKDYL